MPLLVNVGADLGHSLSDELEEILDGPPISYVKAALVGLSGAMEHGAAVLHRKFGKSVRTH